MKAQITLVELKAIRIPSRRKRALNEVVVKRLMESYGEVGQLNPILLRSGGVLVAGRHRYEAAKRLKWEHVKAQLLPDVEEMRQELVEIDENLIRAELTALEQGEHLARRKEIYEALHPEAGHGGARSSGGVPPLENGKRAKSFADDTAEKTGVAARTVREGVQVGKNIDPVAKKKLAGTKAAKSQKQLLQVSREKPERQKAIADLLAGGHAESVTEAVAQLGEDPAEVDWPTDEVGNEIPADMREPWAAVRDAVGAIDKHLIAAQREWTELERRHEGTKSLLVARFLAKGRSLLKGLGQDDGLRGFSGRVRELSPYAVCGNCAGSGSCPGKTCSRVRRAGPDRGTCLCAPSRCGGCDGTGAVMRRDKIAADHEAKA